MIQEKLNDNSDTSYPFFTAVHPIFLNKTGVFLESYFDNITLLLLRRDLSESFYHFSADFNRIIIYIKVDPNGGIYLAPINDQIVNFSSNLEYFTSDRPNHFLVATDNIDKLITNINKKLTELTIYPLQNIEPTYYDDYHSSSFYTTSTSQIEKPLTRTVLASMEEGKLPIDLKITLNNIFKLFLVNNFFNLNVTNNLNLKDFIAYHPDLNK